MYESQNVWKLSSRPMCTMGIPALITSMLSVGLQIMNNTK